MAVHACNCSASQMEMEVETGGFQEYQDSLAKFQAYERPYFKQKDRGHLRNDIGGCTLTSHARTYMNTHVYTCLHLHLHTNVQRGGRGEGESPLKIFLPVMTFGIQQRAVQCQPDTCLLSKELTKSSSF